MWWTRYKDIDLLNAVSRANYTMLTMQRPIKAKGAFDIDVNLVNDQYIFWSVGYKSAAMRKKYKPLKNADPIAVNFGRKPVWNCLTAGKGNRQADQGKSLIYNFWRARFLVKSQSVVVGSVI